MDKWTKLRLVLIVGLALAIGAPLAFAAGIFGGMPQIGGASFSIGTTTVPAGPPSITGLEVVPADTNVSPTGAGPQTALLEMQQLGAGFTDQPLTVPLAAGTNTVIPRTSLFLVDLTTTAANLTLVLPSAPLDGDQLRIAATKTVTALVLTPASIAQSITGILPTTLASAQATDTATSSTTMLWYIYSAAKSAWFRLQ